MPTGYTANVPEIDFEQFVWQCARGMGALIMMRDEPADAPIPEKFEPSNYHREKLSEAQGELLMLGALSAEQAKAECIAAHDKEEKRKANSLAENRQRIAAYKEMLSHVESWEPPTKDHEGLKEFMAEQLQKSIDFDDHEKYLRPQVMQSAEEWLAEKISKANWNIEYHTKSHAEEIERVETRNQWLAALRASLDA